MVRLIEKGDFPLLGDARFFLDDVILKTPRMPQKIVGVGRKYAAHAAELGNIVPEEPILFGKLTSSVIGPGEAIRWRESITTQVDWEGELAVVIGQPARYVRKESAIDYVFGYTIANDIGARDLQTQDKQWVRAKGLDTFGPLETIWKVEMARIFITGTTHCIPCGGLLLRFRKDGALPLGGFLVQAALFKRLLRAVYCHLRRDSRPACPEYTHDGQR